MRFRALSLFALVALACPSTESATDSGTPLDAGHRQNAPGDSGTNVDAYDAGPPPSGTMTGGLAFPVKGATVLFRSTEDGGVDTTNATVIVTAFSQDVLCHYLEEYSATDDADGSLFNGGMLQTFLTIDGGVRGGTFLFPKDAGTVPAGAAYVVFADGGLLANNAVIDGGVTLSQATYPEPIFDGFLTGGSIDLTLTCYGSGTSSVVSHLSATVHAVGCDFYRSKF